MIHYENIATHKTPTIKHIVLYMFMESGLGLYKDSDVISSMHPSHIRHYRIQLKPSYFPGQQKSVNIFILVGCKEKRRSSQSNFHTLHLLGLSGSCIIMYDYDTRGFVSVKWKRTNCPSRRWLLLPQPQRELLLSKRRRFLRSNK